MARITLASEIAAVPLRLTVGTMFLVHGLQKCFGWFGGGGIASAIVTAERIGFFPPEFWGFALAYSELLGGLCLTLGLLTRLACCPLLVVMTVAVVKVHGPRGFFLSQGGFEYSWVILGSLLALLVLGGGILSLDRWLSQKVDWLSKGQTLRV